MPVKYIGLLCALFGLASCMSEHPCAGDLVFDDANALCYACPQGAKFKNYTCECPTGSTYTNFKCVKDSGGSSADSGMSTSDAGADASSDASTETGKSVMDGCKKYCEFTTTCVGGNSLAKSVLADVYTGLHANDAAMCESSCKDDLGSKESTDPAIACFVAGKDSAMCDDPNPQTGLMNTFGLIGQCCAPNTSSELCKSICATLKANPLAGGMVTFCG